MKQLEIIENEKDRNRFQKIAEFSKRFHFGMSRIQIENFVLNDIEFPTPYGKFKQAIVELVHRLQNLTNLYYQIREKEIKIKMKEQAIIGEANPLKEDLLILQQEKLEIQLNALKMQVKTLLTEAQVFFEVYESYPQFHNLSSQEILELEKADWGKKTLNMPTVFEERYGERYMREVLGQENYAKYLEGRRRGFGLLPRELLKIEMPKSINRGWYTELEEGRK